jgi:hypothetical protein
MRFLGAVQLLLKLGHDRTTNQRYRERLTSKCSGREQFRFLDRMDFLPAADLERQPDPPHPPEKPYRAIFLRYSWGLYKHDTLNRIL